MGVMGEEQGAAATWRRVTTFLFGRPTAQRLPAHIDEEIRRQQAEAEILISVVQLLLILFFFVLYMVSPKTSQSTLFRPVPFILSAYLVFAVVRLGLSLRGAMPRAYLVLSVVVDIGLLMLLLWSFHIQYMQPAPFYLKIPTLLYVFILIALRTLRFDPIYVIVAGLTAAVGWLCLVAYAIEDSSIAGTSPITRDFVRYMTSNTVLIGAEVDKVITILVVTFVLALALVRARRLLIASVAEAARARDLSRFVAPEVAERIAAADRPIAPGDGEVKEATVMFCDIAGFSTLSEQMSPKAVMTMLNDYFTAMAEVVDRCGGVITQFQGDAMLITFNAARPNARHAASALATAALVQQVVSTRAFGPGLTLPTRCGINTGEILTGAVGAPDRLHFTVYGDNVNIAARLEQLNKRYGTMVLVTEATLRSAGATEAVRAIGSVEVRGRRTPVRIFAVGEGGGADGPLKP
jgi:adenylate cyclase